MNDAETPQIPEEDKARVEAYALLSRLFYAAPDDALLEQLGGKARAEEEKPKLELVEFIPTGYPAAVVALQQAARSTTSEALRTQYDDLFVGAGRAAVTPYTSGYSVPHAPDRHLLALREQLASWGLVRREATFEVEDHVSAVCDVMRWLIEHDRPLDVQMQFFDEFVRRGIETFCDAIDASAANDFYRAVAGMARAFIAVEGQAFALHMDD